MAAGEDKRSDEGRADGPGGDVLAIFLACIQIIGPLLLAIAGVLFLVSFVAKLLFS
jgi:hypothetical protein